MNRANADEVITLVIRNGHSKN